VGDRRLRFFGSPAALPTPRPPYQPKRPPDARRTARRAFCRRDPTLTAGHRKDAPERPLMTKPHVFTSQQTLLLVCVDCRLHCYLSGNTKTVIVETIKQF